MSAQRHIDVAARRRVLAQGEDSLKMMTPGHDFKAEFGVGRIVLGSTLIFHIQDGPLIKARASASATSRGSRSGPWFLSTAGEGWAPWPAPKHRAGGERRRAAHARCPSRLGPADIRESGRWCLSPAQHGAWLRASWAAGRRHEGRCVQPL